MKKKILAGLIIFSVCFNVTMFSFATSVSDLKDQQSEISDKNDELEDQKKEVTEQKNEALSKIDELTSQISSSESKINELNAKVKELEESITTKEQELEEAEKRQKEQEETLEKRLIAQYKTGKVDYWSILLNPDGFLDFFSNLHNIERIAKIDSELIDTIKNEKESIQKQKEELTAQKSEAKTAKAEAEKESVVLKNAKALKNSEVAKLSEKEKSLQEQIEQNDKEMKELEAQIKQLQLANSNNSSFTYTGGQLGWPVPSSHSISSTYGYRIHPIYGVNKLHTGIDIGGAAWGAPFVAAEDGIVIKAGENGGYGLCVIIDHGKGISTLYGHGSAIYVSTGQTVKKGQTVLGIGSSGISTGKHAHFEVRVNGTPVNPLPYLQ